MRGPSAAKRVETLRAKIAALRRERDEVSRAPAAREEALARIDCYVERAGARLDPPTEYLLAPPADQVAVLSASRRRCCICVALHEDFDVKQGQIAHRDRDSSVRPRYSPS